jgi:hypothetical protein
MAKGNAMTSIPKRAQFALIGVILHPENVEMPWLVQDNRKALKNEFPCGTKTEVLDKVGEILDEMTRTES